MQVGTLTAKTPGRENYGRLQGDVGKAAWGESSHHGPLVLSLPEHMVCRVSCHSRALCTALLPAALGGYANSAGAVPVGRAVLENMSKEQLIELALVQQQSPAMGGGGGGGQR